MKVNYQNVATEVAIAPKNITGAAQTGAVISMKGYEKLTILIKTGAWAGGTSAVTLKQGTNIAFGTNDSLGFSYYYIKSAAGSAYTKTAVTSDTFNLSAANKIIRIEVDAQDLDSGYDCVQLNLGSPDANDDYVDATYILSGASYVPGLDANA